jgi:hypothetical protein
MSEFFKYFESIGVKDIKKLTGFVDNFLQNPSIFFDLTGAERNAIEEKLDEALAYIEIEKS